jgi:hypothetical protein
MKTSKNWVDALQVEINRINRYSHEFRVVSAIGHSDNNTGIPGSLKTFVAEWSDTQRGIHVDDLSWKCDARTFELNRVHP